MTSDRIADLLVARLVRDHGGSKHHWRRVIGPIRVYGRDTHPHCNWNAAPTGAARDIAQVENLLDEVRMTHPILSR